MRGDIDDEFGQSWRSVVRAGLSPFGFAVVCLEFFVLVGRSLLSSEEALVDRADELNWDKAKMRENTFHVNAQGIPVDSMTQPNFLENWANYHTVDLTDAGTVDMQLPPVMLLGADYKYDERWTFLGSIEQGLSDGPTVVGGTTKTKIALGSQYNQFATFPLRAGMSVGGASLFELDFGAGIHLTSYSADLSFGFERGVFAGAKGYNFGFSQRVAIE